MTEQKDIQKTLQNIYANHPFFNNPRYSHFKAKKALE